jgi:uncharacterized protein (TIRG00374 family)
MTRTPTGSAQGAVDVESTCECLGPVDLPPPPTSTTEPGRGAIFTWRRFIELLIELVAIYVLWPWLVAVYSSFGALSSLNPAWFAVMIALEIASFACMWLLVAIPLRSTRWFLIGTSQIVGYAVGLVLPGGNPAGTAAQIYMLANGGVELPRATTGVMAAGLINLATLFALPILALPAVFSGVALNRGLQYAMGLSLLAFVALSTVFLVMLLAERPIEAIGRWVQQLRNSVVRRPPALTGLPERLSAERTQIRSALEARWGRAIVASTCNWLLDYAVLMTALIAVGARVNPAVVLIVYASTIWLAIVPVTPGGVGFVEAGLLGMLMLSGVPGPQAALATLAYRLVVYVGPIAGGFPTYWYYQHRVGESEVVAEASWS